MAKKNNDGGSVIHIGKQCWWDSSLLTLCGLWFPKDQQKRQWVSGATCPACQAANKAGHRL